jgi:hypothetical protein
MSYGAISDGEMKRSAEMSDEATPLYRYILGRRWGPSGRRVNFIMLNPSTADAFIDDPTIRRCIGFAMAWDYDGIIVTNLFALRSTNPGRLMRAADPIGPRNDEIILSEARRADRVIAAWGAHGRLFNRDRIVRRALDGAGIALHYLKLTEKGAPNHPLYLPSGLTPIRWPSPLEGGAS